jgi:site-specific recombinase XerC
VSKSRRARLAGYSVVSPRSMRCLNGREGHFIEFYEICTVQELMGHKNLGTTIIDTHVLSKPGLVVRSPLDS